MPDVLIVGAGVSGLSSAWRLAQEGAEVLVVDRGEPGQEASSAAAGMISPYFESEAPGPLFELCRWSSGLYPAFARELQDETGISVDYRGEGTLCAAFTGEEAGLLERRLDWQVKAGLPVRWLKAQEALALEPALNPAIARAALLEEDHWVNNRRLVRALRAAAAVRGAVIQSGVEASSVAVSEGRARGVKTSAGMIEAGRVIVAAGSWSGQIEWGPGGSPPPVTPVRGQMLSLRLPEGLSLGRVVHGPGCYLVPQDSAQVWVGATMEREGFSKRVTAGGLAALLEGARRLLPGLEKAPYVESWSGLRPESPDGLPILGPAGPEGLFVLTGHFRKGIQLAPATGALAADLVFERRPEIDICPFSPLRFGKERLLA